MQTNYLSENIQSLQQGGRSSWKFIVLIFIRIHSKIPIPILRAPHFPSVLTFGKMSGEAVVSTCIALQQLEGRLANNLRGTWVARWVKHPTSAQVVISRSVSSSPVSGSVLIAQSLEPASISVSPSLSAPPPFALCLSLPFKNE